MSMLAKFVSRPSYGRMNWKAKLPNEENKETSKFMDELVMDMFIKAYKVGG